MFRVTPKCFCLCCKDPDRSHLRESKFTQLLTLPMAFSILQVKLSEIFTDLNKTYKNIPARMKAEAFKQRVVACFKAWEVS